MIREELLRGVPDFALREATSNFAREIKQNIVKYVNFSAGDSTPVDRAEKMRAIDETIAELESEMHELLQDKIYMFLQRV